MKVCVCGLWHLGSVTAACLASAGHDVIGLDSNAATVERLAGGAAPVLEPGLDALVQLGIAGGRLRFTSDASSALRDADVVWVTIDTPVDDDDRADVDSVVRAIVALFPLLRDGSLVLISSQLPVGTTRQIETMFADAAAGRDVSFAYSPENLRLGQAIEDFTHPDRVVAGVRTDEARQAVTTLFAPVSVRLEWMSPESAEMTKHAVNAFLATSVAFINEIGAICEQVGADAAEVERGLKTEARIGPKAYLSAGGAFSGGTLARDVVFLSRLGHERGVPAALLDGVKTSNDAHREWPQRRLSQLLEGVEGRTIAIWGLTYKPGTDTLRRSSAIELCRWLHERGARIRVHDPVVRTLPPELAAGIGLAESALDAADGADALVVATAWPDYRSIDAAEVMARMKGNLILDANRFLAATLGRQTGLRYITVGRGR